MYFAHSSYIGALVLNTSPTNLDSPDHFMPHGVSEQDKNQTHKPHPLTTPTTNHTHLGLLEDLQISVVVSNEELLVERHRFLSSQDGVHRP